MALSQFKESKKVKQEEIKEKQINPRDEIKLSDIWLEERSPSPKLFHRNNLTPKPEDQFHLRIVKRRKST